MQIEQEREAELSSNTNRLKILVLDADLGKTCRQGREKELTALVEAFRWAFHPVLVTRFGCPDLISLDRLMTEFQSNSEDQQARPSETVLLLPQQFVESFESRIKRLGLAEKPSLLVVNETGLISRKPKDAGEKTGPELMAEELTEELTRFQSQEPEILGKFLAVGTSYLIFRLFAALSYHENCYSLSEFHRLLSEAAECAVAGNAESASQLWTSCLAALGEARKSFYYRDPILLMLHLVPRGAHAPEIEEMMRSMLAKTSDGDVLNVMLGENEALWRRDPQTTDETLDSARDVFQKLAQERTLSLIYGCSEIDFGGNSPISQMVRRMQRLEDDLQLPKEISHRSWGTYQQSLSAFLPGYLVNFGFESALHVAFEDGQMPGSRFQSGLWEGCDQSHLVALFEKPLPVDRASSLITFAEGLAETLSYHYHSSAVTACWGVKVHQWWSDLEMITRAVPIFGEFQSLPNWLEQLSDGDSDRDFRPDPAAYQSQALSKSVARGLVDPISSVSKCHGLNQQEISHGFYKTVLSVLGDYNGVEETVEEKLARRLMLNKEPVEEESLLLCQPNSHTVSMDRFAEGHDFSKVRRIPHADVAGCGYRWITKTAESEVTANWKVVAAPEKKQSLLKSVASTFQRQPERVRVEYADGQITNGLVSVTINRLTGGIREIRDLTSRQRSFLVNHASCQLGYRYPFEKSLHPDFGQAGLGGGAKTTRYAVLIADQVQLEQWDNVGARILSEGELVDPSSTETVCRFRQTVTLWAGRKEVDLEYSLEPVHLPQRDPWGNYYALRLAWRDSNSLIRGGLQECVYELKGTQIESTSGIEISTEFERLKLLSQSRPYYRLDDDHKLDALMIVSGESEREFRYRISLDDQPLVVSNQHFPGVHHATPWKCLPKDPMKRTGWFFHVSHRQIQITHWEFMDADSHSECVRVRMMLRESEGGFVRGSVKCAFQITSARRLDWKGDDVKNVLSPEGNSVDIVLGGFEMMHLEMTLPKISSMSIVAKN